MKKTEFLEFLEEITERFEAVPLYKFFYRLGSGNYSSISLEQRSDITTKLLKSRDNYIRLSEDSQKENIFRVIGISELYEPSNFSKLLNLIPIKSQSNKPISKDNADYEIMISAISSFHKIVTLNETLKQIFLDKKYDKMKKEGAIISVDIIEDKKGGINPERIIKIFQSIEKLYGLIGDIIEVKKETVTIYRFESGSTFRAWLKGEIKTNKAFKQLIEYSWQRVYYSEQSLFDRNMKSVKEGLNILEIISEKEKNKVISKSEAKQLKEHIFAQTAELIDCGLAPTDPPVPIYDPLQFSALAYEKEIKQIEHKKLIQED